MQYRLASNLVYSQNWPQTPDSPASTSLVPAGLKAEAIMPISGEGSIPFRALLQVWPVQPQGYEAGMRLAGEQ